MMFKLNLSIDVLFKSINIYEISDKVFINIKPLITDDESMFVTDIKFYQIDEIIEKFIIFFNDNTLTSLDVEFDNAKSIKLSSDPIIGFYDTLHYHKYDIKYFNTIFDIIINLKDMINVNSLTTIKINGGEINIIQHKYIKKFLKILQNNTTLTIIDIHNVDFATESIKEIADSLKINTFLKSLTLFNCKIKNVKEIADMLKVNTTLTFLDLSNNDISSGLNNIADALKVNNTLNSLNLSNNDISSDIDGFYQFAEALKINTGLTTLDLNNNNNINYECVKYLANALKFNTNIQFLNLSYCNLETVGVKEIADALNVNTALLSLNLYSNKIIQEGMKYISDSLKINTTLRSLNISNNMFNVNKYEAAKELLNAVKVNTTLTTLDAKWMSSPESYEFKKELEKILV